MTAATRRTLTGDQMSRLLHAIRAVDDPTVLLPTVLAGVYDALVRQDGHRLADVAGTQIDPQDWQIPVTQWDTIAEAASHRAETWGTGPHLRTDLLDRMPGVFDEPTAPTGTPPPRTPGRGLRLLCVSVRGNHGYLVGNPHVHPIDLDSPAVVPAGIGTRFIDLADIKRYVRTELRGISCYWQVRVVDDAGAVVMLGFRAGFNGTGETWTWRPPT